jgi:hypothetical protein
MGTPLRDFHLVQEKKVQVLKLIPIDLLNKVKEITMTSLLILYNTNLMPLMIYALPPPIKPKQQGLDVEEKL